MKKITSSQNPLVKLINSLQTKKGRETEGAFLVEGVRNVLEAIQNRAIIDKVLISSSFRLDEKIKDDINDISLVTISDNIFKKISTTKTPQGIIAVIKKTDNSIENLIEKKAQFVTIVDSIQDPGNLGTIIRTAAASGADAVIVGKGSVDPYNPKVIRSTMGAFFKVDVVIVKELTTAIQVLKNAIPLRIIAADIKGNTNYFETDLTGPIALVIGNENKGISSVVRNKADCLVKIPLFNNVESLNAGVAAGILIYERVRQLEVIK